jgi:uncharacterized SAM-binding protein YcdF (DUF218 family)
MRRASAPPPDLEAVWWPLRLVGIAGIAAFLAMTLTPLPNLAARALAVRAEVAPADAIVVLSGTVAPDGTLSGESLQRAVGGIRLERQGLAPLLLMSGVVEGAGADEAAARARLARDLGVPAGRILTMPSVHTTRDEASRAREILRPLGVRRILLVTNSFHLARARAVFERADFEVLPAPADTRSLDATRPGARLALTLLVARETLARAYYRLSGAL